jgi:hypothetical protein
MPFKVVWYAESDTISKCNQLRKFLQPLAVIRVCDQGQGRRNARTHRQLQGAVRIASTSRPFLVSISPRDFFQLHFEMKTLALKSAGVVSTVIFYSLIVFFGVVLLAEVQLRSSGGATFDTWRVNYEANRILNEILVTSIRGAGIKARDDANSLSANEGCLRLFDENGLPKPGLLDDETEQEIAAARKKRTAPDDLSGDVHCVVKGYSWVRNDITYFKRLVEEDATEINDLKKSLTSNTEQYANLTKGHEDFLAFKEMEKSWYQRPFIVAPYDLLVLLLVMFMGALGGVIRLLRDYGAAGHANPAAGEYFFIPLIGAVVAIGGYVLAKTGLLLLSSSQAETSLSPFMISMVGIVSGLLAKEVIDTISARGRKILSGQNDVTKP